VVNQRSKQEQANTTSLEAMTQTLRSRRRRGHDPFSSKTVNHQRKTETKLLGSGKRPRRQNCEGEWVRDSQPRTNLIVVNKHYFANETKKHHRLEVQSGERNAWERGGGQRGGRTGSVRRYYFVAGKSPLGKTKKKRVGAILRKQRPKERRVREKTSSTRRVFGLLQWDRWKKRGGGVLGKTAVKKGKNNQQKSLFMCSGDGPRR